MEEENDLRQVEDQLKMNLAEDTSSDNEVEHQTVQNPASTKSNMGD